MPVVRIAEEADAAATDGDALAEGGEAERVWPPPAALRRDHIRRMSTRHQRGERRHPVGRPGRRDRMRRIARCQDMRVGDRAQTAIDPDAALPVRRQAGRAGDRRRPEPARPDADVAADGAATVGQDFCRADLGDGLAVDQHDSQSLECGAHRLLDARALKIAAARPAYHGHLGTRPGGRDLARDLDAGLGAADRDDAQWPAGIVGQPRPQRRRGARAVAGLEPIGMRGRARNAVHVDRRPQRIDGLVEADRTLPRLGRDPEPPPAGIERRHAAADELDTGSGDQGRDRRDAWRDLSQNALLQPHALEKCVVRTDQRDGEPPAGPGEPQRRHQPGIAGAEDDDGIGSEVRGRACLAHECLQ